MTGFSPRAAVLERLPAPDRKFLLELARETLGRLAVPGSSPNLMREVPPSLEEKRACFVTLTKAGQLRGCIGQVFSHVPLYQAVIDNSRSAALRDPRFAPVQFGEVDQVKIEISLLTEPEPLRFSSPQELLEKLQPLEHGVLLQIDGHLATFLPQVWAQVPDKTEFMGRLSQKAGYLASDWRGKQASVSIYRVESFGEN
jgi:AmmeMemoRadiSam system protein A